MADEGEHPRERYFELKLLPLLPAGRSPKEYAAWSRVLRYYADWCEVEALLRVILDDEARGTWDEAGEILGKSRQALHKRWKPRLQGLGIRAHARAVIGSDPAWWSEGPG